MQTKKYEYILVNLLTLAIKDQNAFAVACADIHHWKKVFEAAERHGVSGLLYNLLREIGDADIEEIRRIIVPRQMIAQLWNEHLDQTLNEILLAFADRKVQVVPLKGPVLSERLYGTIHARRSTDIDLLIRESALPIAIDAMEAMGYRRESGASLDYHRAFHHHLCLTHVRRPPLELHFRLFTGFGVTVPSERFLDTSRPYQRPNNRASCSLLRIDDELLYLCVHAAGHLCDRLAWLFDITSMIDRNPSLQWPMLFEQAHSLELATAFSFALSTTDATFGIENATISRWIRRYSKNDHTVRILLSCSRRLPTSSIRSKIIALFTQAILCDQPSRSATYLGHHLGRIARRRISQLFPHWVPKNWSA